MALNEGFTDELRDGNESQELELTRKQITLGMDMEYFMGSQVGRLLRARAAAEIAEFRRQFEELDAQDTESIRKLQFEIAVRKVWEEWIGRAIQEGVAAQETAIDRNVV